MLNIELYLIVEENEKIAGPRTALYQFNRRMNSHSKKISQISQENTCAGVSF